ncbi:MAG: hypothetical protein H6562_15645 [Lewinellaceae bacterium]|nr:hypothetical protein [Lewinella sp.]MCB9280327.1 hypothetical protein [Lewinellaceae bacterium]
MFTNRLNLINIFIILMLGIAVLLNAIGAQFFAEVFRTMNYYGPSDTTAMMDREEFFLGVGFLTFGLFILMLSIGMIMRWRWSRVAFQVVFLLAGIVWAVFTAYLGAEINFRREGFILAGVGAIGLSLCLFGFLFLGNEQVRQHFSGVESPDPGPWEVLDR